MRKSPNEIVKEYLDRKDIKQKNLISALNVGQSAVSKLLGDNDMLVSKLFSICEELRYDFFHEMSMQLPKEVRAANDNKSARLSDLELAILDLVKKNM